MCTRGKILRIISVLIAAALVLCSVSVTSSAENMENYDYDMLPVVMVSGFGATTLATVSEDGSKTAVFPPSLEQIKTAFDGKVWPVINGVLALLKLSRTGDLGTSLGSVVTRIIDPIAMNHDGTSVNNVVPMVSGAENTSLEAFTKNDMLDYVPYTGSEFLDMEMIGDIVGDDRVFNFTYDWRKSHIDISEDFREYIIDVMELTGSDKVNVYSISQGSLVIGAYLYSHADDGFINNVVFDTPVLTGTDLVADIFAKEELALDYGLIADLLSEILHSETDLKGIIGLLPEDFLNFTVNYGRELIVAPKMMFAAAFWDMVPSDRLDECADYRLSDADSAPLRAKTEKMHNEFMSHIDETFAAAKRNGTVISIKTCSGFPLASGTDENSDGIVNTEDSCGASCAALGESFDDSYVQLKSGAYSISPDRTTDLSCGAYPERTWIINGLFHGQVEWDRNSLALVVKLLMTKDGIKDAYSSYEFPQFTESSAPDADISILFECTNCCFLPYDDNGFAGDTLTVKNLSAKNRMIIKNITFEDKSISLDASFPMMLKPGESVKVKIGGTVPDKNLYDTAVIEYISSDKLLETREKTFGITVTDCYAGVIVDDGIANEPANGLPELLQRFILPLFTDIVSWIGSLIK